MVSEEYYYLLTSLDAHTVDLEDFKVNIAYITCFLLFWTLLSPSINTGIRLQRKPVLSEAFLVKKKGLNQK